jgi:CMP-N-acetylneuraminic acid synthetase
MICVIPARGGSRRIPRKNIRDFHGKPIIAYSIELAKDSGLFDRVVVSTEDDEIGAVALAYGAEVLERPSELAEDEIGTQAVVGAALEELGVDEYSQACALYATSPLLTMDDFWAGEFVKRITPLVCSYSIDANVLNPTGGFYFAAARFFISERDPYAEGIGVFTSDMDINTMGEWELAEKIYEERHGTKNRMGK